jgi:hypothetical protein
MEAAPGRAPTILILGTAEWDSPIATNQHYVARELAHADPAGIYFVESLGLRRPRLRAGDLLRMAARVRRAATRAPATGTRRPVPERARIVSPLLVPLHRAPTRAVNRTLLRRATTQWLTSPRPRVLWTFTPVTYGLEADADVTVYHCVDLLATVPGIDATAVDRGQRHLSERATMAIATSTAVAEHLRETGFDRVTLLPNVADVAVFSAASRPTTQRRPTVLFAGNLAPHKVDVDLMESVARALPGHGELLLAGPVAPGGAPIQRRLEELGARHLGLLTLDQLARVAGACMVGLIPYATNAYTRGVSPLKCFEYLASGLAVLSTRLPEVEAVAQTNRHVVTADAARLIGVLLELLEPVTDAQIQARVSSATRHGWAERGQHLRDLLAAELAPGRERPGRAGSPAVGAS